MPNYGFSKWERDRIAYRIEKWFKETFPFNWDWTKSEIKITEHKIGNWQEGDVIDIQPDHLKIFICSESSKSKAKQYGRDFYKHLRSNKYIIFKSKYFPDPKEFLELSNDNWKMTITSYDGALRIYKLLTGNKLEGFEDFGKEVYY